MTCIKCQHGTAKRFGTYGTLRIQRYRCHSCKATFSESSPRPLVGHYIRLERAAQIIALMTEGVSIRAISRLTGADKNTILALLLTVGKKCRRLFDSRVRNVRPCFVQMDEIWTFVHTKEKNVWLDGPKEWGDAYTWIAIDSESKLIISYLVGKRDQGSAYAFVRDLRNRIATRCQITSDGLRTYVPAIEEYFGADVDFAQLVKIYGRPDNAGPEWYGPGKVIEAVPTPVTGNPDLDYVSTSHVERSNLTLRMQLRRFTRLTNGFSKSLSHLKAAVDVYMAWYNFCRYHQTIRMTPAMEAGLTDRIWSIVELLSCA
ncbi:MAG: IS1/IS6 family transposase [Acidobacteria bacterium]|nr:IS1/IS6 family transposase [Acidobacteriota bacterium]